MIPNLRSKNWTTHEVIHREPDKLPKELHLIAGFVQGILQGFSNHLFLKFGKRVRLIPTSGYRSPHYNSSLEGASDNSYHMWRIDQDGYIVWAVDLWSPDITQDQLYEAAAAYFNGEVYKHRQKNLVHVTNYGANEDLGELF